MEKSSSEGYSPERSLFRPEIKWRNVFINVLLFAAVCGGITVIVNWTLICIGMRCAAEPYISFIKYLYFPVDMSFECELFLFVVSAGILVKLKAILIFWVHVYQRYAPDKTRLACCFTPSCSEYMILAIRKYGVIRGVCKGLDRLQRCHAPNGGEDFP